MGELSKLTSEIRRIAVYENGELKAESAMLPAWDIELMKLSNPIDKQ